MIDRKESEALLKNRGLLNWLPIYIGQRLIRRRTTAQSPTHVIFCFVDHFEPFNGGVGFEIAQARVNAWSNGYPNMAERFRDADGLSPKHTWFYPPHLDHRFLEDLLTLSQKGYGEIEMHLHHNHIAPFPDTEESLRAKIMKCIKDYSKYGVFCLPDGSKRFAFIHGDWSLANSRGATICGVNNEIRILRECGCFADFTFPSLGDAQPAMINQMYYCKSDSERPKSYNSGRKVRVHGEPWGDMLMISGILGLRWSSRTHLVRPSIEASNVGDTDYPFPARIDYWVRNAVTITGRPEWRFIKIHTHSAREEAWDSVWGEKGEQMHEYLGRRYNDGRNYTLHYVSAREMYNIVKAAEAGEAGNPGRYRDYVIPKYIYLEKESK